MAEIDDINSNLGALEEQLTELSRLKSLVERLSDAEEAATDAIGAAEHIIERFDDTASRIEEAEVLQQIDQLRETVRRLESVRDDLEEHPEEFQRLTEKHEANIEETFSDAQEEWNAHRENYTEQLQEVRGDIEAVAELLEGVQFESRFDTLQDMTSSANQASQNSLSRIDAVERGLSDTLDDHRRQRTRQTEQFEEEIADLRTQFRSFETLSKRLLWVIFVLVLASLVLTGTILYTMV